MTPRRSSVIATGMDDTPQPDCQTKREHDQCSAPEVHFVKSHRPAPSDKDNE